MLREPRVFKGFMITFLWGVRLFLGFFFRILGLILLGCV